MRKYNVMFLSKEFQLVLEYEVEAESKETTVRKAMSRLKRNDANYKSYEVYKVTEI